MSHVGTGIVRCFRHVWAYGDAITGETILAHVAAPGEGVAVAYGVVHHGHQLVNWKVVACAPAPVVLNLQDERLIERMMGVRGERHIVVHVQTQRLHIGFRSVGLALINELFWNLTEIGVENGVEAFEPSRTQFLLLALGDAVHIAFGNLEELVEVWKGVAVEGAWKRHGGLGNHTIVLHAIHSVIETAALRERDVAVQTYAGLGTVLVGLVGQIHLAQVVFALALTQQLCLKKAQA